MRSRVSLMLSIGNSVDSEVLRRVNEGQGKREGSWFARLECEVGQSQRRYRGSMNPPAG